MIKVEVIENFTLEEYNKLKNVKKVISRKENEFGVRDTFECDEKMADYLTGNNALNKVVVKVIEIEPKKDIIETIIDVRSEEAKKILNDKIDKIEKMIKPKKKKSSKKGE